MLGSLVNGGTLYLRGSDWNATLEQVSPHTLSLLLKCINLSSD